MEKYISYKNILFMLLGFLLCLGIKVALNLGKLPIVYQNYQKNSAQLQELAQADQIIGDLATKIAELQKKIGVTDNVQSPIYRHLDFVKYLEAKSREKKASLIALPTEEKMNTQGFQLSKESFSLESGLSNILDLLHKLEWEDRTGSIVYLDLNKRQILQGSSRKQILVADVELQRLLKP